MKNHLFKYGCITILLVLMTGNGDNVKSSVTYANEIVQQRSNNKKAPAFTLNDLDGKKVKLSDYAGKVVILDFWATWCPPCRAGVPDLVDIQTKYKKDVVVIGISLDDVRTQGDIPPFIKQYGINYPVVIGTMDVVYAYGNISAIPTSFIIDQSGNVVKMHVGLVPKETIEGEIDALLGKT